jgi:rod shape-determining protein MreC
MYNVPPPLFKQGAPARVKVFIFTMVALALLVADSRLHSLTPVRLAINFVLYPLQRVALLPRDALYSAGDYFSSISSQEEEIRTLRQQHIEETLKLQQAQQLAGENAHLRQMLALQQRTPVKSALGEILYDARDPFTRKVILNLGSQAGLVPGQPVIDDMGVVGQITRVFLFTSEVTLLTDQEQAIPVQVLRNGLRSVAYGRGHAGSLELRFVPNSADIKEGDVLATSGIDGIFPAGLSVAKVIQVEPAATGVFGRILCQPLGGIDRDKQLLVLLVDMNVQPRPPAEESERGRKRRGSVLSDAGQQKEKSK